MRAARTKGPWSLGQKVEGSVNNMHQMVYCDDDLGSRIADCSHQSTGHLITDAECVANAEFIVKCENHWDALVEAASEVVEGTTMHRDGYCLCVPEPAFSKLQELLAKLGVS